MAGVEIDVKLEARPPQGAYPQQWKSRGSRHASGADADAFVQVDFAGDAANYGISLAVLFVGLAWRSRAAMVKGLTMAAFGLFVLGKTGWTAIKGAPPEPLMMGAVAVLALLANGVFGTGSGVPDILVVIMAGLALSSGVAVMRQASQELARDVEFSPAVPATVRAGRRPDRTA